MSDLPAISDRAGLQWDLDREQAIADLEQSIADRDQVAARDDQRVEDEEQASRLIPPTASATGARSQSRQQTHLDHSQAKQGRHQDRLDRAQAGRTKRQDAFDVEPDLQDDPAPTASRPEKALDCEANEREDAALMRAEAAIVRARHLLERAEATRDRARGAQKASS
jgi:hypothetical protein